MSDITLIEDLAHQNLKKVPENVLNLINLKMLYLEGNNIETLPDNLFKNLKQLTWLDMRNNQLQSIPSSIMYHTKLETLLLQNNNIKEVPQELGFVPNLSVLQLSGNPVTYPDKSIIEKGVKVIIKFLQNEYSKSKLNSDCASSTSSVTEANSYIDHNTIDIKEKDKEKHKEVKNEIPIITLKSYHRFILPTQKKERTKKLKKSIKSKAILYKKTPHSNSNKSLNMLPKKKNEIRIQEQFVKDLWLKNLKDIMLKQQDQIQKEQDQSVIKNWRQTQKVRDISNIKYRPEAPYDYDPKYDRIPNRHELLLKRIEKAQKQLQHPGKTRKLHIDHMINDIIQSLREMEREKKTIHQSPIDGMEEASREIKQILAVQKRISALKLHNDRSV